MENKSKEELIKTNLQILKGLVKKHGTNFELVFKYETNVGKLRKRQGKFIEIIEESKVKIYNDGKDAETVYELSRITGLHKKST